MSPTLCLIACLAARGQGPDAASPGPSAGPDDSPAAAPAARRVVYVQVAGLDRAALLRELALRIPGDILQPGSAYPKHGEPRPFVYVVVTGDGGSLAVRVITRDGRAYDQRVAGTGAEGERLAAIEVAHLLVAIDEGRVAPTRSDVAIPAAPQNPGRAEDPAGDPPTAEPLAAPEPGPTEAPAQPSAAPARTIEIGPHLGLGTLLAVGPPRHGDAFLGWTGSLGLDLRAPDGLFATARLRVAGRAGAPVAVRFRAHLAVGYALRIGDLELPISAGVLVEPWFVRPSSAIVRVGDGGEVRPGPLLGGLVAVEPGYRIARPGRRLAGVRVGVRIELAGSFVIDGGPRTVGLSGGELTEPTPRARLGGLELATGLSTTFWFDARRRPRG